ncbi:unnamed protein product [Didymodactylos carnosus]|uniref:Uncharacterized protein n=1 Tax=Didymodactylos carnosus TaxID=1234261 RepID=A0A815D8T8_9BILA|nr:unnamed protein product [Didymodactylos carnosus]CAF4105145.1 unnamed protein product [Didymodactylos carnosus]
MNLFILITTTLVLFLQLNGLIQCGSDRTTTAIVNIYSNFAEIVEKLDDNSRPTIEFSEKEWENIRSDTIILICPTANITVTSQTVTEQKRSLNGEKIFIRDNVNKSAPIMEVTMIDETKHLIEDRTSNKGQSLYYTINTKRQEILQTSLPPTSKYLVSFTYRKSISLGDSQEQPQLYVSYLYSKLNWRVRYQLLLSTLTNNSVLLNYADIRNDGLNTIKIDHGELFSGDINIQMNQQRIYTQNRFTTKMPGQQNLFNAQYHQEASLPSIESSGTELAGIYKFTINKPFEIEPKTNYLLPMFEPTVYVRRFGLIDKVFNKYSLTTNDKVQRSYCLLSKEYLPKGQVILREDGYLVGETAFPNLAANEKYTFSIGQDADITYNEQIHLLSTIKFNDTSRNVTITRLTYEIHLKINNHKHRVVSIGYKQQFPTMKKFNATIGHSHSHSHSNSSSLFFLNPDNKQQVMATFDVEADKVATYKYGVINEEE